MKRNSGKKSSFGCSTLLILLLLGVLLFTLLRFLMLYTSFTVEEPVAQVIASPPDEPLGNFKLAVTFMEKGEKVRSENYYIKGNRWLIKGELLQWHRTLGALGLKKMYRLTHIQGQYVATKANAQQRSNGYTLIDDDQSTLWRLLSSVYKALGLVQIQTIRSEAQPPVYKNTIILWVSAKGFLALHELERPKNSGATIKANHQPQEEESGTSQYPDREEDIRR